MTMLAVFKSRAQTLDFVARLKEAGVPASAVSTPREANVGCGISARFEDIFFARASAVLRRRTYSSFAGYMKGTESGFLFV